MQDSFSKGSLHNQSRHNLEQIAGLWCSSCPLNLSVMQFAKTCTHKMKFTSSATGFLEAQKRRIVRLAGTSYKYRLNKHQFVPKSFWAKSRLMTCCTTDSPVILLSSIRNGSTVLGGDPCDDNENPLDPAPSDKKKKKSFQEQNNRPTVSNVFFLTLQDTGALVLSEDCKYMHITSCKLHMIRSGWDIATSYLQVFHQENTPRNCRALDS